MKNLKWWVSAKPFEQQQFGPAGVEGVNKYSVVDTLSANDTISTNKFSNWKVCLVYVIRLLPILRRAETSTVQLKMTGKKMM